MAKSKEYVMNVPVAEILADYSFPFSRKLQYRKETCFLIDFWRIHYSEIFLLNSVCNLRMYTLIKVCRCAGLHLQLTIVARPNWGNWEGTDVYVY